MINETVEALRQCSATLEGKYVCDGCFRHCVTEPRLDILDDAAAALARFMWRNPSQDPPKMGKTVIVAFKPAGGGACEIGFGTLEPNFKWYVYGTYHRGILAWMEGPELPKRGENDDL